MDEPDVPDLSECLAAFAARDYVTCYHAARRGLSAQGPSQDFVLGQLIAICVQRLGQSNELPALPRLMLEAAADDWEKALVRLTFGQETLDSVWPSATDEVRRCQALYYAGARLLTAGRWTEAERYLRGAVQRDADCVEKSLAEADLAAPPADDTAAEQAFDVHRRRAQDMVRRGEPDEAIRIAEEACDLARRTWGQDDAHFAQGLHTLMLALSDAGRVREAVELAPLAVRLAREHFADEADLANLLNTVAYLHKATGGFDEARSLYLAAAELWGRSAEDRREVAATLNNLAQMEVERGELDQAEQLLRRVLDLVDAADGSHRLYATALGNLAVVRERKGDLDGAERLHREALDHQREVAGEDHRSYAVALNNLGHLYKGQGRFAEAEPLLRRAADIVERKLGAHHPTTLTTLGSLLEVYQATGQQEAADRLIARARPENHPVPDHGPHTLHPIPALAPVFRFMSAELPLEADDPAPIGGGLDWRSPSYQQRLTRLADRFAEGPDGESLRLAILLNAQEPTHEVLQIFLMCGADGTEEAREFEELLLSLVADPWQAALVALTLGLTEPAEVEQLADDDVKTCQLLYYAAQRSLAEGHRDEALADLGACASSGVVCFEAWMAARILRAAPRASDRDLADEVAGLTARTNDLLERGDFTGAVSLAERGWRRAAGLEENSPERTHSLYNLGQAAYRTGDLVRAEQLLCELVTVAEGHEHRNRVLVAGALNVLGNIHADLARFELAEPALLDALEQLRLAGRTGDADYVEVQGNLAEVYGEMGDVHRAIALSTQALRSMDESLGSAHPMYARILTNVGNMLREIGDLERAEGFLEGARQILRETRPAGHPDLAAAGEVLAALYLDQRRFTDAEGVLRSALEIRRNAGQTESTAYAAGVCSLGLVHLNSGRIEEARRALSESRAILDRLVGPVHPFSATVLTNLGQVHAVDGDLRGAFELTVEAEEAHSRVLFDSFATASERLQVNQLGRRSPSLSNLLSLVAALGAPDDVVDQAFDLVLRRKGLVGEAQTVLRDGIRLANDPDLEPKTAHVRSLREKIARKTLSGPGPEGPHAHQAMLAAWAEEKERLEAELSRTVPATNLEQRLRQLNAPSLRSLLPPGSALVEIVRFGLSSFTKPVAGVDPPRAQLRYWAFVLRPDERLRLVDLGAAEEIDRLVTGYRDEVVGTGAARDLAPPEPVADTTELDAGTALRAAVFDPLATALGDARRLFLCPDGDLSRLPWEVLPVSPDRRLVDDYEISYLGSGRDLLRVSTPSSVERTAPVVIADPDFDLSAPGTSTDPGDRTTSELRQAGLRFDRLPGTEREGRAVAALLGVPPLTGASATESAVKSCLRPRVLHIATHGYFLPDPEQDRAAPTGLAGPLLGRLSNADESPFLRSGLALAGANTWLAGGVVPTEAEDGILTAEDVTGMDLAGTELVTLSACETGLGAHHFGEGVLGLRRAFTSAGARTVVMSLWRVPDAETQTLMTGFYGRILAGEGRAAALRHAQLELRKARPHPYYWGAFICHGDPEGFERNP
ncbi:tetratricopeptide repeat protein [Saccharothrix carnea]|uniref:Tetratricopeptide repeat protein n=1 Tax=Saccharothrix carnea TaxID=1280637 RepID=A0A2P8I122_SACCR|nr:CHAT domain-containing protein [Saccharothrix carnea]PSL52168.1 tetratricopeptide repeat protein [Saccharothrix carnea]